MLPILTGISGPQRPVGGSRLPAGSGKRDGKGGLKSWRWKPLPLTRSAPKFCGAGTSSGEGRGRTPERLGRTPARRRLSVDVEFLTPVHKRITEETVEHFEAAHRALVGEAAVFRGTNPGNVHTSAGLASDMGLAATVAPEELSLAYLHELLDRRFGIDFRQGGRLTVNYRRPIYAGDNVTARGMVTGREQDGERTVWKMQVWVENGRSEPVVTGDAQVTAPSPLT